MYINSLLFWCYCSWARNKIRQGLYVISCLYWTINVLFLQVHTRRASNAVQTATLQSDVSVHMSVECCAECIFVSMQE